MLIETARLLYAPTPLSVLRERARRAEFHAELPVGNGSGTSSLLRVRFPEEWPGDDALQVLPIWIARREREPGSVPWVDGVAVLRAERLAVGSLGFKGPPDPSGSVEVGYSINRSMRGRGYATEVVAALGAWALAQPGVRRVTAECLPTNAASIRVLEKSGFVRVGRRISDAGILLLWERRPAPAGTES